MLQIVLYIFLLDVERPETSMLHKESYIKQPGGHREKTHFTNFEDVDRIMQSTG